MTPLERAVVDAAIRYATDDTTVDHHNNLIGAVDALLAATPDAGQEYTWGEVAEGDQVFIPRTGRWWPIIESRLHTDGRMRIIAKGAPKILTPDPAGSVMVRRGDSGNAVDTFNSIMISGPRVADRDGGE